MAITATSCSKKTRLEGRIRQSAISAGLVIAGAKVLRAAGVTVP